MSSPDRKHAPVASSSVMSKVPRPIEQAPANVASVPEERRLPLDQRINPKYRFVFLLWYIAFVLAFAAGITLISWWWYLDITSPHRGGTEGDVSAEAGEPPSRQVGFPPPDWAVPRTRIDRL